MIDGRNPYALLPPSQRLMAAARAAGVMGGKAQIDAWAREVNWTGIKRYG